MFWKAGIARKDFAVTANKKGKRRPWVLDRHTLTGKSVGEMDRVLAGERVLYSKKLGYFYVPSLGVMSKVPGNTWRPFFQDMVCPVWSRLQTMTASPEGDVLCMTQQGFPVLASSEKIVGAPETPSTPTERVYPWRQRLLPVGWVPRIEVIRIMLSL